MMHTLELVRASAGSGKTTDLCQTVAAAAADGLDPARILATTFTKKAAAELKGRIQTQLLSGTVARVRRAIEQRGGELFDPAAGAAAGAPELPALLAWEARIEAVREWPFDTLTLVRFSLFVLIPLASWLGGAVVERLLDLALS